MSLQQQRTTADSTAELPNSDTAAAKAYFWHMAVEIEHEDKAIEEYSFIYDIHVT
ncbi:hypothetical protein BbINS_04185 [Bartonella bacilliformis INS]|uniref:Uncharacterized protein n=2 Tax=Bartonella bacilliformis TaxID=774 RepID=A1UT66_BARBK|nr:hypothetical protein BARBAKC583_0884 [Bartonella bacilliformis KC583]EKS43627.1 hypothetical protein BbINS_04185 [Bartonella bacilliformis INS]